MHTLYWSSYTVCIYTVPCFPCECTTYLKPWLNSTERTELGSTLLSCFSITQQTSSVTVLRQLRSANVNDTRLTCSYCTFFRRNMNVCMCIFIWTYANEQINTNHMFKGLMYLWGGGLILSFFKEPFSFFYEISPLYVYSLNKSDKVRNVVIPVFCDKEKSVESESQCKCIFLAILTAHKSDIRFS